MAAIAIRKKAFSSEPKFNRVQLNCNVVETSFRLTKQIGFTHQVLPGGYSYATIKNDSTNINKNYKFLRIKNSISEQYSENKEIREKYQQGDLINKVRLLFDNLQDHNPDVIKVLLTSDETLFFTIKIKEFTFFVCRYLDFEEADDDIEFSLVSYRNDVKLPSIAGGLTLILNEIRHLMECNQQTHVTINYVNELPARDSSKYYV